MRHLVLTSLLIGCLWAPGENPSPLTDLPEHADDADEHEERVLVSEWTRVKKDYLLTGKEFIEHSSRKTDFGKIEWTLPELIKKAENFINKELMAQISPTSKWPPEGYNDGYEYPVGASLLDFTSMEFRYEDDFAYIVLIFYWRGQAGELLVLNVVAYLDGEIARVVDHDPKNAQIIPRLR